MRQLRYFDGRDVVAELWKRFKLRNYTSKVLNGRVTVTVTFNKDGNALYKFVHSKKSSGKSNKGFLPNWATSRTCEFVYVAEMPSLDHAMQNLRLNLNEANRVWNRFLSDVRTHLALLDTQDKKKKVPGGSTPSFRTLNTKLRTREEDMYEYDEVEE